MNIYNININFIKLIKYHQIIKSINKCQQKLQTI